MIIKMHDKIFTVYGELIEECTITKAYVLDERNDPYLLMWRTGEEPRRGNVNIVKIDMG